MMRIRDARTLECATIFDIKHTKSVGAVGLVCEEQVISASSKMTAQRSSLSDGMSVACPNLPFPVGCIAASHDGRITAADCDDDAECPAAVIFPPSAVGDVFREHAAAVGRASSRRIDKLVCFVADQVS
jgi:hypothetical protein